MEYWLIWVNEQLPEYIGFSLDKEKQIEMAKELYNNADCISDMGFEMRGGRSSLPEIDYKRLYEIEKAKNEALEKENAVYLNSVCRRNNADKSQVRIESDSVMIYK